MGDDTKNVSGETHENKASGAEPAAEQPGQQSTQSGPKFTPAPDPLAGVKKSAAGLLASMEGKTVSMKLYVGTIIAIVILMLLARCGT